MNFPLLTNILDWLEIRHSVKTSDVLKQALSHIVMKWGTGNMRYCSVGAVYRVSAKDYPGYVSDDSYMHTSYSRPGLRALRELNLILNPEAGNEIATWDHARGVVNFNDSFDTTEYDVIELFTKAIANAESKGD